MSYARVESTGHYIYPCTEEVDGIKFDGIFVDDDTINVFLYKLFTEHKMEFLKRLQNGKVTILRYKGLETAD